MKSHSNSRAGSVQGQATSVDSLLVARSINVDRNLGLLNACVADRHYTLDALAASTGVDRAYVDRVLKGTAPLRLEFEVSLPKDLLADFRKRQAEDCGLVCIEPLTGMAAQRAFVAGALGLMTGAALPDRASAMAKATIPNEKVAVSA